MSGGGALQGQSSLPHTWISLFSLKSITPISAWSAAGNHWIGLLDIFTVLGFGTGGRYHTQEEDSKWGPQKHGPYLRMEKNQGKSLPVIAGSILYLVWANSGQGCGPEGHIACQGSKSLPVGSQKDELK